MNYNKLFIEETTKPLMKNELYDLFIRYRSGDITARKIIIERNIYLVLDNVSTRFSNVPYDKQELVSIGLIGLIKSVDNFDISKTTPFSHYATKYIINEIIHFIEEEKSVYLAIV